MKEKLLSTNPWIIMTVLLAAIFMTLLDVSIVNVALPSIKSGLGTSHSALEWIVSGYALALGLLLIPAGRLGDNIGHRRIFLIGLSIFSIASLACAFAQSSGQIITFRFIQGLGAGIYTPAIVAYIQLLFEGRARSRAFGIFGTVIGVATAIGPLLGGILVELGGPAWGWRLIFLVNVPVAIVVLPLAYKLLPRAQTNQDGNHRLDPVGIFSVTTGLLLLLFPLVEGRTYGWPWWTYASFALSLIIFTALWYYEKHIEEKGREPLLSVRVLRQPAFAFGSGVAMIYFAAFTSIFFTLSILWQSGFEQSAFATGLVMTPFAIGNIIASSQSHRMSAWLGRWVLPLGSGVVSIGLSAVLLILLHHDGSFSAWLLTAPLFLAGLGSGTFIAPNQDFVLKSVPRHDAGSASGMFNTAQRIGSSLGIAAVGTVLFSHINPSAAGSVSGAFLNGSTAALRLNVVLALLTFALSLLLLWQLNRLDKKTPA